MADVGDDFGHVERANGSDAGERIMQAGYTFVAAGENVAVGPVSAQQVVEGWLESDGHCAAIMTAAYTEIGVGYAVGPYDSRGERVPAAPYWTQTFGRPR